MFVLLLVAMIVKDDLVK